jgi:hypothetical protein
MGAIVKKQRGIPFAGPVITVHYFETMHRITVDQWKWRVKSEDQGCEKYSRYYEIYISVLIPCQAALKYGRPRYVNKVCERQRPE